MDKDNTEDEDNTVDKDNTEDKNNTEDGLKPRPARLEVDATMEGVQNRNESELKPKLDQIFAEVEKHLPSVDFDVSDTESEDGETSVFRRQIKASLFDEEKDLDTSLSDIQLEDMDKIQVLEDMDEIEASGPSENKTPLYDNDLAYILQQQNDKVRAIDSNWNRISESAEMLSNAKQSDQRPSNIDAGVDLKTTKNIGNSISRATSETKLPDSPTSLMVIGNKEKSYSSPGDLESNVASLKQDSLRMKERELVRNYLSPNAPVLATRNLSNINLDALLESLNEIPEVPPLRSIWTQNQNMEMNTGCGEGQHKRKENTSDGGTLIEKLARITMNQSGEDLTGIDPCTGALRKASQDQTAVNEEKTTSCGSSTGLITRPSNADTALLAGGFKKTVASCGTNTYDLLKESHHQPVEQGKKMEPDTVFVDVRDFERRRKEEQYSIERVQKILGIDINCLPESSDSEDEVESWSVQRRKMKEAILKKDGSQKLNSKLKTKAEISSYQQPTRVTHMPVPEKKLPADSNAIPQDLVFPTAEFAIEDQKQQQKLEAARKAHEQKEKERQSRVRLRRHLEALRPTASVLGRQPSAENTSLVFDMAASYELGPSSLPRQMTADHECLLLKVHLSSNGEIVLHRNKANKSVDSGMGLSASYTTLLTWLLSLVPSDFTFMMESSKKGPSDIIQSPFHVIGLQQLWLEEQMSLVIAVIPASHINTKSDAVRKKKINLKDDVKDASVFYQLVTKYLSRNSLDSVCHWLTDMVSIGVDSNQSSDFVYKPPLPNITTKPLSTFIQVNPNKQAARRLFNLDVGFFWQTVDSGESYCEQNVDNVTFDTQNTMSIVYKKIYQECHAMMGVFNRILQEGLNLAGVRLLYPIAEMVNTSLKKPTFNSKSEILSDVDILNSIGPVLAIAIRGTFSHSVWLDVVGPLDPPLARRTDPNSLCALYGGSSRDECWLFCPRAEARVLTELARWFGGRVPASGVFQVGIPYIQKDNFSSSKSKKSQKCSPSNSIENTVVPEERPPAALTATTLSNVFFVLSPWIPPSAMGIILSTCQRRGYQLRGVRRMCLSTKKANAVGISPDYWLAFCPGIAGQISLTSARSSASPEAMYPVTVLLLQGENAVHNVASLVEACMVQLALQGVLGNIQVSADVGLSPLHLFYTAPYSDGLLSLLGGNFSKCSDYHLQPTPGYIMPQLHTNPELEQIVLLLLLGHDIIKTCGLLIGGLLNLMPHSRVLMKPTVSEGLEFLGLKWLQSLSFSQANEVTPYEAGDIQWKKSVHDMTREPVLIVTFRGVNAFKKMQSVFPAGSTYSKDKKTGHLDKLMSASPEDAYTFARLFFLDKELYPDPLARSLLSFIPDCRLYEHWQERLSGRSEVSSAKVESILQVMMSGPSLITTVLVVKPTTVIKYFSKVLKKLDQEGFQIVGMRLEIFSEDIAKAFIARTHQDDHLEYMSAPCLCLCLQRENAIKKLLDLIGPSDPKVARQQNQFLWRGVFGTDLIDDAFYASPSYVQSVEDVHLLFPDGLCSLPTDQLNEERITAPNNDALIDLKFSKHRHAELKIERSNLDMGDNMDCRRLLMQVTCILFKPILVAHRSGRSAYVEIIEELITLGFEVIGARQVWLNRDQAEQFLHILSAGSFDQVPELTTGGSIVLALQRQNAVVGFNGLLGRPSASGSLLDKFGIDLLRPANTEQAEQLLAFFFDRFPAGSIIQVEDSSTVTVPGCN